MKRDREIERILATASDIRRMEKEAAAAKSMHAHVSRLAEIEEKRQICMHDLMERRKRLQRDLFEKKMAMETQAAQRTAEKIQVQKISPFSSQQDVAHLGNRSRAKNFAGSCPRRI